MENTHNKQEKIKRTYKLKSKFIKLPDEVKVPYNASELIVITKTKNLVSYIFQITQNAQKKYRASFVNRLQNLGLACLQNLIEANFLLVDKTKVDEFNQRQKLQKQTLYSLKMLEYFAMIAFENGALTAKQCKQIALLGNEARITLQNWINSDKKRIQN